MREIKFRAYFEDKFWYFTLNEIMERAASYQGDWDIQALKAEKQQFTGQRERTPNTDDFYLAINTEIRRMQDAGLEVEVQYQQSEHAVSALILGRKEKEE